MSSSCSAAERSVVDLAVGNVGLDDGGSVPFDRLVVATGAAPRTLPIIRHGMGGVHVLRTLEDSLALRAALETNQRVVVIGAGWIGAEVAAACRARDLDVTVLEALDAPMVRGLGYELGAWAAELHRAHGVKLLLGVGVVEIEEVEGRVSAVVLGDGTTVPADVLVVAVGVVPSVGWLEGSGLTLDNGVACDASGFASGAEHVLAVGDVARWWNPLFQRDVRVEHWSNAVEQADWAARSLLSGREAAEELSSVPYFWSDQYGKKIQYVGVAGEFAGVVEGGLDEDRFVAIFTSGDRLVGALCVSTPGRMIRYRRLIAEGAGPEAVEAILPAK